MSQSSSPTETSPLLSNGDDAAAAKHLIANNGEVTRPNGSGGPSADEEGQVSTDPSAYKGMKDVKLGYIMPALAIGVRCHFALSVLFNSQNLQVFLAAADQTIIVSSYGKIGSDLQALNSTSWVATA